MKIIIQFLFATLLVFLLAFNDVRAQHKTISRDQLEYYLARSIDIQGMQDLVETSTGNYTTCAGVTLNVDPPGMLTSVETPGTPGYINQNDVLNNVMIGRYQDMLRLIGNVKAKFITTAMCCWGTWEWQTYINRCQAVASDIKCMDPDIIVQAAPNEQIDEATVISIGNIPNWVFTL